MSEKSGEGGRLRALALKYKRLITFGGVGALNTLFDFAVYSLVLWTLAPPVEWAQAAGYFAGLTLSYILNKNLTFRKDSTTSMSVQIVRFIVVNALSFGLSVAALKLLVDVWGVNPYLAKVPVTLVVMTVNYLGYKIFVFGVRDQKQ